MFLVTQNLVKVIDDPGNQTTMVYDTLSRKIRMTDPDMCFSQDPNTCYWTYTYDANGNLTAQTDAKGQTIGFIYLNPAIGMDDPLNRVIKMDYPSGTDIVYTYDQAGYDNPKGRLTSVTDSSGMTEYFYDERGRIKKTIKTVDAVNYAIETTYDSLDRVTSIKYPDLEIVSYTYDTAGNLQGVSGAENYANYTSYNALGQPINVQYGNGVSTTYTYDPYTNRLGSIQTNSGQTLQSLSYIYDDVGNVTTITDSLDSTRTQQFQYDHLNRLTQADSQSYPTTPITYQYNQIGNMTYNSQVGSYVYGASGGPRPHAAIQAGPNTYTYDNSGNMIVGVGRTMVYDYDNRPISITQSGVTGFVYDYQGQRVKKIGSSTTVYIGKLYEITGGVYTKHIFVLNPKIELNPPLVTSNVSQNFMDTRIATENQQSNNAFQQKLKEQIEGIKSQNIFKGGSRIASKDVSNTYYYHKDHLGSSNVVTNVSGIMVEEIYYFPYGAIRLDTESVDVKHKYTGQEEDSETGFYYYGARYYDAGIGRFISPDTIVPDYQDPQALNRYSYVRNNPLNYIDPTGYWFTPIHGQAINYVFIDLPPYYRDILIQQQYIMDSFRFPDPYFHAMRERGQEIWEAWQKANAFLYNELSTGRTLWQEGHRVDALIHLGNALHTVQDATSPVHDFKEWNSQWNYFEQFSYHTRYEIIDPGPGSRLYNETQRIKDLFFSQEPLPTEILQPLWTYDPEYY